jgi:hypothetical protein
LIEELEDRDDIRAYDKAVSRKQQFIPLDQALKQIETSHQNKK